MSIWKFLSATLPASRKRKALKSIKTGVGQGPNFLIGKKLAHDAKYCVLCNQDDLTKYGEFYLRRDHQIPGVLLCQKHNCFLETLSLKSPTYSANVLVAPLPRNCKKDNPKFNQSSLLSKLNDALIAVANGSDISKYFDRNFLSEFGKQHRYILRKNWDHSRLEKDIDLFYQELKILFPELKLTNKGSLIPRTLWLVTEKRSQPIYYVLMQIFIDHKTNIISEDKEEWKCVNNICPKFETITHHKEDLKYTGATAHASKVLTCKQCRMETQVSYTKEGAIKKRSIIKRGDLWTKMLKQGIKDGLSQEKLGKILGVNALTISYHANRFGIKHPWTIKRGIPKAKKKDVATLNKSKDQKIWLKILTSPNFKSVSESRTGNWSVYNRLKKSSPEWLRSINKKKYITGTKTSRNLKEHDKEVHDKLLKGFDELKGSNIRSRLTKNLILRSAGFHHSYLYSQKHIKKSIKLLEQLEESVEEFQIRRIDLVVEEMRKNNISITKSAVKIRASIHKHLVSRKVFRHLESICE